MNKRLFSRLQVGDKIRAKVGHAPQNEYVITHVFSPGHYEIHPYGHATIADNWVLVNIVPPIKEE